VREEGREGSVRWEEEGGKKSKILPEVEVGIGKLVKLIPSILLLTRKGSVIVVACLLQDRKDKVGKVKE
jgi:hypothetical protein